MVWVLLIIVEVIGIVILQAWRSQTSGILLVNKPVDFSIHWKSPFCWYATGISKAASELRLCHGSSGPAFQLLLGNEFSKFDFFLLFFSLLYFCNSALALPLLVLLINRIGLGDKVLEKQCWRTIKEANGRKLWGGLPRRIPEGWLALCPKFMLFGKTTKENLLVSGKNKYIAWWFLCLEERMSLNGQFHTSRKMPFFPRPLATELVIHILFKCMWN